MLRLVFMIFALGIVFGLLGGCATVPDDMRYSWMDDPNRWEQYDRHVWERHYDHHHDHGRKH